MVSVRSEKPICAPPCLSQNFPPNVTFVKQFQNNKVSPFKREKVSSPTVAPATKFDVKPNHLSYHSRDSLITMSFLKLSATVSAEKERARTACSVVLLALPIH